VNRRTASHAAVIQPGSRRELTMAAGPTTLTRMSILAVVPDLYFATRIAATAKAAGVELELVTAQRVVARLAEQGASLVIVELSSRDSLALIAELKRVRPAVPVVGFGAHVEEELLRGAKTAGADAVLPRSQLVGRLSALLERGLSALTRPGREDLRL
jgi:DNA-binding NarL/FixJ family response regulator